MSSVFKTEKIINIVNKSAPIAELSKILKGRSKKINVKNLKGALSSFILSGIWHEHKRPMLIITENKDRAKDIYYDLSLFINISNLALLTEPKKHVKFDAENLDEKAVWLVDGLSRMLKLENTIAITTPDIWDVEVPEPDFVSRYRMIVKKNQALKFEQFIKDLFLQGFERQEFVSNPGDVAVRGGIVDIFPIGWENPVRLDFWGNEVESIREFNALSQRSIKDFDSIEFLANVFHSSISENKATVLNYLDPNHLIVVDSPDFIENEEREIILPEDFQALFINKLGRSRLNIKSELQPDFNASVETLAKELRKNCALGMQTILCADGAIHVDRLKELVRDAILLSEDNPDELNEISDQLAAPDATLNSLIWLEESISEGFSSIDLKIACYTEHQIFNRLRMQKVHKSKRKPGGISLGELRQLHVGDYVAHDDKGIGRFDGFETVTLGGSAQDCIRLIFDGGDKLYVHLNYIHKVRKYTSQEGAVPKLNKLGAKDWARKKARAKKKLKDIARDLIKLYAERKSKQGYAFPADNLWQKEFEASFIYEDTPDQSRTTEELKKDMESETPMDRLVCGDVGFGKTEIAIRAAFKAVLAGKQAAVLVPTTILAQQHYMTFKDRLSRYPVNVDVISRFRKKKSQSEIIAGIEKGSVDILIGTHRLLSKDIDFKDLGLLIIDEEHRFGVSAKEKLRSMKSTVDTLTLTATPIPRTLNFSLMGARDLSVIETPPRNRLPVHTEIIEWNQEKVIEAFRHEIDRGGQIYYVTDKVRDIEKITNDLRMLMPAYRFGIAHGQMKTNDLEKVMEKFIRGDFDVLVCTKIVESGLDIPNANTMFINRSQNFGLAELYQLRGRVGRSNNQAFCYLIIPQVKTLASNTLKRLQAIEEFTDLGSGFQLAMRDMEIRGAGNLLGAEQSGYINEIGFELFQKILDEAVSELRMEEFSELFEGDEKLQKNIFENEDVAIELNTDALLPSDYIASETERFSLYKKLYNVRNSGELDEIILELEDRFGKLPPQAKELAFAVRLRIAAIPTGFVRITLRQNKLVAEFPPDSNKIYYQIAFPEVAEYLQDIEDAKLREDRKKLILEKKISRRDEAIEIMWKIAKTVEMASE